MEIQELISFTTIVQQGSFSKASKKIRLLSRIYHRSYQKSWKENLVYNYLIA